MPRNHHYDFAKRLIPKHVFESTDKMFEELTGHKREAFLMWLWGEAAPASGALVHAEVAELPGEKLQVLKLEVVGHIKRDGTEVVVISMPPALEANEALYLALVRNADGVRVYFYERCTEPAEAALAAVSPGGGRANYGFHPGLGLDAFLGALEPVVGISLAGMVGSLPEIDMAAFVGGATNVPKGDGGGGVGTALEWLLLARAAFPLALFVTGSVIAAFLPQLFAVAEGVKVLLGLAVFVVLLVWLWGRFKAYEGQTKWGPGMAIGSWFIPCANLILVPLVVGDLIKTATKRSPVMAWVWWAFWLAETVLASVYAAGYAVYQADGRYYFRILDIVEELPDVVGSALFAVGYVTWLVPVAAYLALWFIVRGVNRAR